MTSASRPSASLTRLEQLAHAIDRDCLASRRRLAHRRLPERFFFLRGGAGGGPAGLPFGSLPPTATFSRLRAFVGVARSLALSSLVAGRPLSLLDHVSQRLLLLPGWSERAEPLPHDRLLHDRPQVRRDPVDEQAGRELPDEQRRRRTAAPGRSSAASGPWSSTSAASRAAASRRRGRSA